MKALLIGAGRFARPYVDFLLSERAYGIDFAGVVDNNFVCSPVKQTIAAARIPVYKRIEDFYAVNSADIAIICTPPYLHEEQSVYALSHGSDVLCEKPAAPTVAGVERMIAAEKRYGKFIAIGFQWSFSDTMQNIKRDILDGVFGKPVLLKTFISWPRDFGYYANPWSGKISKDGKLVLDSVVSNACAHFIHNMLFLLGESFSDSRYPDAVEAECLRANDIESYDTCVLRMTMKNGATLYFGATHAAEESAGPEFIYVFDKATLTFDISDGKGVIARFADGTEKNYGIPEDGMKKTRDCIRAVKSGVTPVCTAKTALAHTRLAESVYENVPVYEFPAEIKVKTDTRVYVKGLYEIMRGAYAKSAMLSEYGCAYVQKTHIETYGQTGDKYDE